MSQEPISAATLADAARRFTLAFNENDLDGVMEWFAEDSVYDQFDGTRPGRDPQRIERIHQTSGFWRSDNPRSDNSLGDLYLGSP